MNQRKPTQQRSDNTEGKPLKAVNMDQRQIAIAHHEAGHAIALLAELGVPESVDVHLVGDQGGLCKAQVLLSWRGTSPIHWHEIPHLHAFLRYCLAGRVAEFMFTGQKINPVRLRGCPDVEDARQEICDAYGLAEHQWMIDWLLDREVRRLRSYLREHWAVVTALAEALDRERRLDTAAILEIVGDGLRRPHGYSELHEYRRRSLRLEREAEAKGETKIFYPCCRPPPDQGKTTSL